jgi:hypothetical protein
VSIFSHSASDRSRRNEESGAICSENETERAR